MYDNYINGKRVLALVNKGATLVDMRTPVEFRDGSIVGSVNLPLRNFLNHLVGVTDKASTIIMFSTDKDDADVTSAVNYATQLGFSSIYTSTYSVILDTVHHDG